MDKEAWMRELRPALGGTTTQLRRPARSPAGGGGSSRPRSGDETSAPRSGPSTRPPTNGWPTGAGKPCRRRGRR
eukprot:1872715-Lingulodinium_polyedra.AAC.1